ncbi:MAG: response regulator [Rhodanobacteraceae bacterium]
MHDATTDGDPSSESSLGLTGYLGLSELERTNFVVALQKRALELEDQVRRSAAHAKRFEDELVELRRHNEWLTERAQQESANLLDTQLQLQRVVANVVDYAIFMLDATGHVLTWNIGAERIKGYRAEEIIGKSFRCFYTEEDRVAGVPQNVLASAERSGHFEMESWRVRKDGSRFWANVHLSAIRDEDGTLTGFIKITRDMTERRNFEEQLRQSQKMEAIGQLTGGVAHDFNNLLTIILGNLEKVHRASSIDPEVRRDAEQAIHGAQRAATLTRQLLAFSRQQPLNPIALNVEQFVAGMGELLQRTLGENIKVKTSLSGRWRCEVDEHQLESAILNLAVNARDAMPEEGSLLLDVSNMHLDGRTIGGSLASGDHVVISVSDTGTGMPREVMDRALEPFFTTKPVGQGTGLGLSQVYGFVKQSGGHLNIYSECGQGTTVKIYLPRYTGVVAPAAKPRFDEGPRGDETILLVEDEEGVRAYCADILRDLGYRVIEANNASSAMQQLAQGLQIDLLLTDLGLPGVHGGELARRARSLHSNLPVLFISGYAAGTILQRGRIAPDAELLEKPFSRADLANRVRRILDAARAKSPHVLVVEDEPLLRGMIIDSLHQLGMQVSAAASASEALAMLGGTLTPDLALVDVRLGEESGLAVIRQLRVDRPHCPVIVATGYGEAAREVQVLADDKHTVVLSKPYGLEALTNAITALGFADKPSSAR